jgi:hypothetical protein
MREVTAQLERRRRVRIDATGSRRVGEGVPRRPADLRRLSAHVLELYRRPAPLGADEALDGLYNGP